jgi:hypothetical protein
MKSLGVVKRPHRPALLFLWQLLKSAPMCPNASLKCQFVLQHFVSRSFGPVHEGYQSCVEPQQSSHPVRPPVGPLRQEWTKRKDCRCTNTRGLASKLYPNC